MKNLKDEGGEYLYRSNGGVTTNKRITDAHRAAFEVMNNMESFDEYKQV